MRAIGIAIPFIRVSRGAAPFQGLLDLYPNAAAAYSLRKLRAAYSGSAVRIRRSSDNAESDIGFLNNEFDSAAAVSFVGANNGFNAKLYDQANSYNADQTTAANQQQIVNTSGVITSGSKAAIQGGSSLGAKTDTIPFASYSEIWVYMVLDITTTSGGQILFESSADYNGISGAFICAINSGNLDCLIALPGNYSGGNIPITTGRKIISIKIKTGQTAANTLDFYVNGSLVSKTVTFNNTSPAFTNQILSLFSRNGNAFAFLGKAQEYAIFTGDQSANNAGIISNLNTYYNVY
jgi:hypothetical protein